MWEDGSAFGVIPSETRARIAPRPWLSIRFSDVLAALPEGQTDDTPQPRHHGQDSARFRC